MPTINDQFDFSRVADVFLAHGSLQSPAFLDGRLSAGLALHDLPAEQWQALMDELLEDRYLAEDVRQVERERISRDGGSSHGAIRQR